MGQALELVELEIACNVCLLALPSTVHSLYITSSVLVFW